MLHQLFLRVSTALGSGDFATIMEWADEFRRMEASLREPMGACGSWPLGPPLLVSPSGALWVSGCFGSLFNRLRKVPTSGLVCEHSSDRLSSASGAGKCGDGHRCKGGEALWCTGHRLGAHRAHVLRGQFLSKLALECCSMTILVVVLGVLNTSEPMTVTPTVGSEHSCNIHGTSSERWDRATALWQCRHPKHHVKGIHISNLLLCFVPFQLRCSPSLQLRFSPVHCSLPEAGDDLSF